MSTSYMLIAVVVANSPGGMWLNHKNPISNDDREYFTVFIATETTDRVTECYESTVWQLGACWETANSHNPNKLVNGCFLSTLEAQLRCIGYCKRLDKTKFFPALGTWKLWVKGKTDHVSEW